MSVFPRVVGKVLAVTGGLNSRQYLIFLGGPVESWVLCHGDGKRHYATGMARDIMPRGWRETLCHRDGEIHHEHIAKVWRSQLPSMAVVVL